MRGFRFIVLGTFVLSGIMVTYAQNEGSSLLDRKLGEVVVTAKKSEIISPGVMKITPMSGQKRLANTAGQLLSNLNMAMFKVNEKDQSVALADGQSVALYINGQSATKEELRGLRPTDVRHILVLDNPTDPKYNGVQHVIDYILREETGGYAKLSASETFLNGSETDGDIFTKFNQGKLTYSFFANGWHNRSNHGGVAETEVFNLLNCTPNRVERISKTSSYKNSSWSVPVTGKLSYASQRFMMNQTVGYSHDSYPGSLEQAGIRNGNTSYSAEYKEFDRQNSNSLKWICWYYFMFPKAYTLMVSTVVDHSHNKSLSTFDTDGLAVENRARENSYIYSLSAAVTKQFGRKHSLMLVSYYMYTRNMIDYFANGKTHFTAPSFDAMLTYSFSTPVVSLSAFGGINYHKTNTNGVRTERNTPAVGASFNVKTGTTSRLSGNFQYKTGGTGSSAYNSEIFRQDEMKYYTGDPDIVSERRLIASLSWNWNPSNRFSFFPYMRYLEVFDRITLQYSRYEEGILQQWQNVGNFKRLESGINASYAIMNGRLAFSANPRAINFFSLGTNIRSYSAFAMNIGAMYMIGNFRLSANWEALQKELTDSGAKSRLPATYDIEGTWYKGNWSVGLKLANLFRSSWNGARECLVTNVYEYDRLKFSPEYHRSCMISATYTFDYGRKKVNHNQDVQREAYRNSAILTK